jgi:uncharacterized membrane protein HdeD (DUF308 family)
MAMKHKIKSYLSKWQLLLSWIVANAFGIFIGIAAAAVLNDTIWDQPCPAGDCFITNPLQRLLTTGICIGCFVGIAQWFFFKKVSRYWVLSRYRKEP